MRLLLDLQCVQSSSSRRGIGRYALCLASALNQTAGENQVEVLLNAGDDADRLMRARTALETFLPARSIHVFEAAWPFGTDRSQERRTAAESARTASIRSLAPDVVLVGSVFEGDAENVLSIERTLGSAPTAAILFDLIPAAEPGVYLLGPGAQEYWRRFEHLKRADLLLSISDYSADQARQLIPIGCPPTASIWGGPYASGAFPAFEHRSVESNSAPPPDSFLLSVGGDHPRKNLDRLVAAWGRVAATTRRQAPLVIACHLNVGTVRRLRRIARRSGIDPSELILTGEVSEARLASLYDTALAFVFPSTQEGLGMPPLEAMARNCPTALARSSSLVELADDPRAFFDPLDLDEMARTLAALVLDANLRQHLRRVAAKSASLFTWTRSAALTWSALGDLVAGPTEPPAPTSSGRVVQASDEHSVRDLGKAPAAATVHASDLSPGSWWTDATGGEGEDTKTLELYRAGPPGLRSALAATTALLTDDEPVVRSLVAGGLLDQPLVPASLLITALRHDPVTHLASLIGGPLTPELVSDVVAAAARSPRWSLERPLPVLLLLRHSWDDSAPATPSRPGVLLVCGGPGAATLADRVDHVALDADLVSELLATLHRARRHGTGIHVVVPHDATTAPLPEWMIRHDGDADDPTGWQGFLNQEHDRRTGWPWRRP